MIGQLNARKYLLLIVLGWTYLSQSRCHARSILSYPLKHQHTLAAILRPRGGGSGKGNGFVGYGRTPATPKTFSSESTNPFASKRKDHQDPTTEEQMATKEMINSFLTRDSRNTFIARVYAILAGQLVVTAGSVALFGTQPALRQWTVAGNGATVPIISLVISTVAWAVMCASSDARRKAPLKWWLLGIFTLGEAVSVGFISSFYVYRSVISAMLTTAAATTSVSLYTVFQRNAKYDLTQWGAGLSSCAMIFLVYGIIGLLQTLGIIPATFLPYNDAIYSFIGASLFSFYLAHHTKLITAGKHAKYQMSEKDYVFGAMTLYNDIINMFIYILRIIGEDRER